jgi:hypothetical protein
MSRGGQFRMSVDRCSTYASLIGLLLAVVGGNSGGNSQMRGKQK